MIVVDSNVLAYLTMPEVASSERNQAEALLNLDPDWQVPLLWRSELRNVAAGYLRRGLAELEGFLSGREHLVSSDQVLSLVASSSCSAYDCEFVALARQLGTTLVTEDRRVRDAFPETALSMVELVRRGS